MKLPPHDPNSDVPFPPPAQVREVQSHKASLSEAIANTLLGLVIAFTAQVLIAWMHGLNHITFADIGILTFWMTTISVLRGYMVRRLWESEFWRKWRNHDNP